MFGQNNTVYLKKDTTLSWVRGNIPPELCNNMFKLDIEDSFCSKEILIIAGKRNLFVNLTEKC